MIHTRAALASRYRSASSCWLSDDPLIEHEPRIFTGDTGSKTRSLRTFGNVMLSLGCDPAGCRHDDTPYVYTLFCFKCTVYPADERRSAFKSFILRKYKTSVSGNRYLQQEGFFTVHFAFQSVFTAAVKFSSHSSLSSLPAIYPRAVKKM